MVKKKPCDGTATVPSLGLPKVYYRLHALLQTIRSLQYYEDELCAILMEIQRRRKLGARSTRNIAELLNSVPGTSLQIELEQAFSALDDAAA